MNKAELRKEIRIKKKDYTLTSLIEISKRIIENLEKHPKFIDARTILLYHSLNDEVYTHDLIERWKDKKRIILPVVNGDDLDLKEYNSQMEIGSFNIMEPTGEKLTDYSQIDLAVVPGMAFDESGNRLGRGKGYYDKILSKLSCYKIGICFPFQLCKEIPTEIHDIRMDEIISM